MTSAPTEFFAIDLDINDRTGKADDGRVHQQAADLIRTVYAKYGQNNADDDQNGNIGCEKQEDSFHRGDSFFGYGGFMFLIDIKEQQN